METVTNFTTAASKAIWGTNKDVAPTQSEEPISGVTGDVKAGEPYDAGNIGSKLIAISVSFKILILFLCRAVILHPVSHKDT